MLLEFGLSNFFSLKEGAVISFRLDAKAPDVFAYKPGISSVVGVKGANASGKTNILRGLTFISIFAAHSFAIKPDEPIPLSAHFKSRKPSDFYAEFESKGFSYTYELSATDKEVVREAIYRKKKKKILLVERLNNKLEFTTNELKRLHNLKLRKNVSLISLCHQHEFKELNEVYEFFESFISNVTYSGLDLDPITESEASERLYGRKSMMEFVSSFISECDVGVSKVEVLKIASDSDKERDRYIPVFHHGSHALTSHTESSGTRALYRNLVRYKMALEQGSVMIADEMDIHLHSDLLPKIIGLFTDLSTNPKGAQLIFTTHDVFLLDLLGRYRTILVNKVDNESFAYRLDEIPGDVLRNDRPISTAYLSGKIGGAPNL